MKTEDKKNIIEIWKTIVEVQKHFNDIEMKVRGLFVSMVLALAAAQGFLMEKALALEEGKLKILYATFIPLIGFGGTLLFYFMDKHWYHRLLVGAVKHAIKIEDRYKRELPELGLSASIGDASPVQIRRRISRVIAGWFISDSKYRSEYKLHSDGKIEIFYKPVAAVFLLIFFLTIFFTGVLYDTHSLALLIWENLRELCSR